MKKYYKLSDEFCFQLVKTVQLGMLTRTNIVDHLRQFRLEESETDSGSLKMTPEYSEYFNNMVKTLLEEAEQFAEEAEGDLH